MTLTERFKSFDMFGTPVGVNYKGEDSYKTKFGALVSILLYTIVGWYSTTKVINLVTRN